MTVTVLASIDIVLQADPITDVPVRGPGSLVGSGIGAFLTTLIVGGILLAVVPRYTERMVRAVSADPVKSFLYGFLGLVLLFLLVILLVITIVGILLAIPLVILAYLVWAVGATIAFLTIGDRIVGHDDGWLKPLLVAAGINGVLALTGIGSIISFVIGAVGLGTILRDFTGQRVRPEGP